MLCFAGKCRAVEGSLWRSYAGRQRCMLLPLGDHHLIAKMFSILLERSQFRHCVFAHEEIPQRRTRSGVQALLNKLCQPLTLGDKYVADDGLQRRVTRPDDFLGFQECEDLDQDEGWGDISFCQQRCLLKESRPVGLRPDPVPKQFGDLSALRIPLASAQRPERYHVSREVALQQEFNVLSRYVGFVEVEESVLCLEIAKLEQAMQTFDRPFASVSNSTLDLGEGEELGALEVVKIGQAVKRCMLGLRQHG